MEYHFRPDKPNILVCEDESAVRDILRDFLTMEGFDVTLAEDGAKGREHIRTRHFDVVLTDLEMPNVNGIQLLQEMQTYKNKPVAIVMTGYGTVQTAIEAMKNGAFDYIMKPFQIEQLAQLILKALEHKRLSEDNIRLQEMVAFYRISEKMTSAHSFEDIFEVVQASVEEELEPDVLTWWRRVAGTWEPVGSWSREGIAVDVDAFINSANVETVLMDLMDERNLLLNRGTLALYFGEAKTLAHSSVLVPMRIRDEIQGVLGAFRFEHNQGFTEGNRKALQLIADRAGVGLENLRLYEDLQQTFLQTIESLVSALEAKDEYTKGHSERVMKWAMIIADLLRIPPLDKEHLRRGALLHDIGKIGLNMDALNKPQPLTPEEYEAFKLHPVLGKRILEPIEFLQEAIPGVMYHHERWDGKGYPEGLAGNDIPLPGRILCVADSFEVMITDRVYRKALSLDEAKSELQQHAGQQFDERIASLFLQWLDKYQTLDDLPVQGGRRVEGEDEGEPMTTAQSG